eukprot:CAMPEP_0182494066 /NCGR_PEP_ID=MMETSP1321-20130603/2953_1 /TAXON_ID=91990 /ORGANISM="Bolidomonas sp., Strain RCC1657" /LENGTH=67 /DNA_ID=CAMNT_0024697021 /DNA_START=112 /DNA_END=311 /DNA_ORIENTATION=+
MTPRNTGVQSPSPFSSLSTSIPAMIAAVPKNPTLQNAMSMMHLKGIPWASVFGGSSPLSFIFSWYRS